MEEKQTNFTIMEGYELPSGGQIYDVKVNPHIELRSMTARDEMKRTSPSTTPLKTLADIIEGCMIEKPAIHVYDMAIGDYEFLLHKLRIVTYGPEYKMAMKCPYCGSSFDAKADLEDLTVKDFDIKEYEKYKTFNLPKSGRKVTLNFTTPRMLDESELRAKELKRKYKDAELDFETYSTLKMAIKEIDGVVKSDLELEGFIDKLPASDMNIILNHIDKINAMVGLDNSLTIKCPSCRTNVKAFFRFGPEFFRPTVD